MNEAKAKESIIVAPTGFLPQPLFQGFIGKQSHADLVERVWDTLYHHHFAKPRGEAEQDPNLKQIIPYCTLIYGDEIFVAKRLETQGEERLHNKRSIGIGGHMNPIFSASGGNFESLVFENLKREIEEEIKGVSPNLDNLFLMGMINDDSDEVGQVHLGLVFKLLLDSKNIRVRETDQMEGQFYSLEEANDLPGFENWSRIVLDSM